MMKIAIVGVGTVGASVAKILEANQDVIRARAGKKIEVVAGVVKNLSRDRGVSFPLYTSYEEMIQKHADVDVVVELMGGVDDAKAVVEAALKAKKAVVTANKALLAYHRSGLQELANGTPFGFEASVAGGIPIIRALRDGLSANNIVSIKGIINGTCNYMLTKMFDEKIPFDQVLKEAQSLGYAEADPTFDIGGFDAAHKLLVLSSLAFGVDAKPEDILIEGIGHLSEDDIAFAREFGYSVKSLAIAQRRENRVSLRVNLALIPKKQMIAKVDGVMNGISIVGDKVGETFYFGAGAGGDATASAVISDLVAIARGEAVPMLGYKEEAKEQLILAEKTDISTRYYLRILVEDVAGVLAQIASILAKYNISIETVLQRKKRVKKELANLLLSTHEAQEKDIIEAIHEISRLGFVKAAPVMIRIEG